jgi:hypothetical protein
MNVFSSSAVQPLPVETGPKVNISDLFLNCLQSYCDLLILILKLELCCQDCTSHQ